GGVEGPKGGTGERGGRPPRDAVPSAAAAVGAGAGRPEQTGQRAEPVGPSPQVHEPPRHHDARRTDPAHGGRAAGVEELWHDLAQRGPRKDRHLRPNAAGRLRNSPLKPREEEPPRNTRNTRKKDRKRKRESKARQKEG